MAIRVLVVLLLVAETLLLPAQSADTAYVIRDVRVFPDGAVYVLTDSPNGKLLKLTPAAQKTTAPRQ